MRCCNTTLFCVLHGRLDGKRTVCNFKISSALQLFGGLMKYDHFFRLFTSLASAKTNGTSIYPNGCFSTHLNYSNFQIIPNSNQLFN